MRLQPSVGTRMRCSYYTVRDNALDKQNTEHIGREIIPKSLVIGLWFSISALPLIALYQCIDFGNLALILQNKGSERKYDVRPDGRKDGQSDIYMLTTSEIMKSVTIYPFSLLI